MFIIMHTIYSSQPDSPRSRKCQRGSGAAKREETLIWFYGENLLLGVCVNLVHGDPSITNEDTARLLLLVLKKKHVPPRVWMINSLRCPCKHYPLQYVRPKSITSLSTVSCVQSIKKHRGLFMKLNRPWKNQRLCQNQDWAAFKSRSLEGQKKYEHLWIILSSNVSILNNYSYANKIFSHILILCPWALKDGCKQARLVARKHLQSCQNKTNQLKSLKHQKWNIYPLKLQV